MPRLKYGAPDLPVTPYVPISLKYARQANDERSSDALTSQLVYHDGNKPPLKTPLGLSKNEIRADVASPHGTDTMAKKRLLSYLRTERKRAGLTQRELALLVGHRSNTQLSRFERLKRIPTTETLIALTIIFRKSSQELFPDTYNRLLNLVHLRALALHEELQGNKRQITRQKLETLEAVLTGDDQDKS